MPLKFLQAFTCAEILNQMQLALSESHVPFDAPSRLFCEADAKSCYSGSEFEKLENDIVSIYTSPPAVRSAKWQSFAEKWKFTTEESAQIEAYYGLMIFDGDPSLLGSKQKLFKTVKDITLRRLLEKDGGLRSRHDYYQAQIGKLSVPEIAAHLNMTQADVYREISFLDLSVVEAFKGNYEDQGNQATAFVRHYLRLQNRGVEWSRMLQGERESVLLVNLFDQGLSHAEIAHLLNDLAGITSPSDSRFRTEKSVAMKLGELGLTNRNPHKILNLSIEPYGIVKVSGQLVPATASEFLFDHRAQTLAWCAENLGVSESGLRSFIETQHLEGLFKKPGEIAPRERGPGSGKGIRRLAEIAQTRRQAYEDLSTFVIENKRLPKQNEWGKVLGFSDRRFFGSSIYAPGKETSHLSLHPTPQAAYEGWLRHLLATEKFQQLPDIERNKLQKALENKITSYKFDSLETSQKREIATNSFIAWVLKNKKFPGKSDWRIALDVQFDKFFGVNKYAAEAENGHLRMNENNSAAYQHLLNQVEQSELFKGNEALQGKITSVIKRRVDQIHLESLEIPMQRSIVNDRLIAFVQEHSRLPVGNNEWDNAMGLTKEKFSGSGQYADGERGANTRLNNSSREAIANLLAQAEITDKLQNLPEGSRDKTLNIIRAYLKQLDFENLPLSDQRIAANDSVINFMIQAKSPEEMHLPKNEKEWESALGFNLRKYYGQGDYNKNDGDGAHKRLNDSAAHAFENLLTQAQTSQQVKELPKAYQEKLVQLLQQRLEAEKLSALELPQQKVEINRRIIFFLIENNRLPVATEFRDNLRFSHERFFGYGSSKPGGHQYNTRLNSSTEEAYTDLLIQAETSPELDRLGATRKAELLEKIRAKLNK